MAQKLEPVKQFKATDGRVIYMLNGKLHNWDDVAIIHPNGKKEYYLFGMQYTKDEFLDRKREEKGVPPAKDPKYDSSF